MELRKDLQEWLSERVKCTLKCDMNSDDVYFKLKQLQSEIEALKLSNNKIAIEAINDFLRFSIEDDEANKPLEAWLTVMKNDYIQTLKDNNNET